MLQRVGGKNLSYQNPEFRGSLTQTAVATIVWRRRHFDNFHKNNFYSIAPETIKVSQSAQFVITIGYCLQNTTQENEGTFRTDQHIKYWSSWHRHGHFCSFPFRYLCHTGTRNQQPSITIRPMWNADFGLKEGSYQFGYVTNLWRQRPELAKSWISWFCDENWRSYSRLKASPFRQFT